MKVTYQVQVRPTWRGNVVDYYVLFGDVRHKVGRRDFTAIETMMKGREVLGK